MYLFVFVAAAMALYFALATLQRPQPAQILAVILWAAYAVYEYFIANGTLCDANCNIRVDLVLFFPILGIATYLALKRDPSPRAVAFFYVICQGLVASIAAMMGYKILAVIAAVGAIVAVVSGVKAKAVGRRDGRAI